MDDREKNQLEAERDKGSRAQRAYEDFFAPFLAQKEAVIIEAFRTCEMRDEIGLMNIKMQFTAIDALNTELLAYIDTGKLASTTLNQVEADAKAKDEGNEDD